MPGTPKPELVVIHHTDCGMERLSNPTIHQQMLLSLQLVTN
jgi:carbonic anhydrase